MLRGFPFVPRRSIVFGILLLALALPAQAGERVYTDAPRVYSVFGAEDSGAYLGVQLREETEYPEGGARVTDVVDESPAEEAGIREDDIIIEFDGATIRGPVALTERIHSEEPGNTVTVRFVRDGTPQSVEIELGDRAERWKLFAETYEKMHEMSELKHLLEPVAPEPPVAPYITWSRGGRVVLGVQLVEVTAELRRHLGASEDAGVLVSKVIEGTPAERAGIAVGDLIVSVGGATVEDTADLRRALTGKQGESFTIEVIREKRTQEIDVSIPEPEDDRPTGPRASVAPAWGEGGRVGGFRVAPAPPAPPAPAAPAAPAASRGAVLL